MNRSWGVIGAILTIGLIIAASIWLSRPPAFLRGLNGPAAVSADIEAELADWRDYETGSASRLAILLTDEDSAWLGLVHGLRTIGVPFVITRDAARAVQHSTILAYPIISGALLEPVELDSLRQYVAGGGTLIATQVLGGGLQDVFGFERLEEGRDHYEVSFGSGQALTGFLTGPREQVVRLGNPERPESWIGTQSFVGAQTVLGRYQDGAAAFIARSHAGGGQAYALGFDLGFFILRANSGRDEGAGRDYANGYEPSVDVWLRLVRAIYRDAPDAVTLATVPDGQALASIITFDVDYQYSVANMAAYADVLTDHGVHGTFFIQTKYFRDYLDRSFFDQSAFAAIRELQRQGMEIGSHSVSHTDVFSDLPLGSGEERYPGYQPRVGGVGDTRHASVLGELRVSRFLLEALTGETVTSFRPGYLATPDSLPEALEASGYRFSTSISSGTALTHLPYKANFGRRYASETAIFEFPISLEDEQPVLDGDRLAAGIDLAASLARYGGVNVVLIHPNETGEKLAMLDGLLTAIGPNSWIGTLQAFGDWWAVRDTVQVDVSLGEQTIALVMTTDAPIEGLTVQIPETWRPVTPLREGASLEAGVLVLPAFNDRLEIEFRDSE